MLLTLSQQSVTSQVTVKPLDLPKVRIPTLRLRDMTPHRGSTYYQNCLANAMHGLGSVRILDLSKVEDHVKALEDYENKFSGHLDGATGSRKKGLLIGTINEKGIIESYFTGSKRITHGSILFSECDSMFGVNELSYVVKSDDSPGLGDCHGMISRSLYQAIQKYHWMPENSAIQFRFGVTDHWTAKGVVVPYPDEFFPKGVNLVLPESSFKGACPELNVIQTHDAVFGVRAVSKSLRFKSSHQVIQCFESPEAQEYILECAKDEMKKLIETRRDTVKFSTYMLENLTGGNEEEEESALIPMPVLRVASHDKYYQLAMHPTIVKECNKLFAKRCKDIATGKFFRCTGLTAIPLTNVKPGYVITSSLKTGTYLKWRYPVRHYGDVTAIKVVNPFDPIDSEGNEVNVERQLSLALTGGKSKLNKFNKQLLATQWAGCFVVNPQFYLQYGGDFDGDMSAFLSATEHKPLLDEVKSWVPLPVIEKPEKKPHGKTLKQVASDSINNNVAQLANMMSYCRLFRLVDHYAYLGEQIQLVVDSLKSDTGVDHDYIEELLGTLTAMKVECANQGITPWLKIYKADTLFVTKTPAINEAHNHDVINRLFNLVTEMYINGSEGDSDTPFVAKPNEHFDFLFTEYQVSPSTLEKVTEIYKQYAKELAEACRTEDEESRMVLIKEVLNGLSGKANTWRETLSEKQVLSIAAAFWGLIHRRGSNNSAACVFRAFHREVIAQLQSFKGQGFRLWKQCEQAPSDFSEYNGEEFEAWVRSTPDKQRTYLFGKGDDDKVYTLGRIITDGVTNGTCIPKEEKLFGCRLVSNRNDEGKVTFTEATITWVTEQLL